MVTGTLMSIATAVCKVVMSSHENMHAFIDSYIRLLPESDLQEFQKVLEMKVATSLFCTVKPRQTVVAV